MAEDFMSKYFGEGEEVEEVLIPTGGSFQSFGFIGPVELIMAHRLFTKADVKEDQWQETVPQPDFRKETKSGAWFMYYIDYESAVAAQKALGIEMRPTLYWIHKLATGSVLNSANLEKLAEGFGPNIFGEARVMTYRSKTHRHEFHLIALPSLVAAVAKMMGMDNGEYHLSELTVSDVVVDDSFQEQMIGDISKMNVFDCILGQRRADLWKALGEEDVTKYTIKEGGKLTTDAPALRQCLRFVHQRLKTPIWARLMLVTDPRVEAGFEKDGGEWVNGNVPAIIDAYNTEDEARKAAQEDLEKLEEQGVEIKESSGKIDALEPRVPAKWSSMKENFVEMIITPLLGESDDKIKETVKAEEKKYGCSPEEVLDWVHYLQKQ